MVDSKLLKRYQSLTHSRINASIHESAIRVREHSPLWTLIVASYRAMWGFPLPAFTKIDQQTSDASMQIAEIARKSIDNEKRWPKACQKIAEIIADWMPEDDEEQLPGCSGKGSGKEADSDSGED